MSKGQRAKLTDAGVPTMAALAATLVERVPGVQPELLARLKAQAALQVAKRTDGQDRREILPLVRGKGSSGCLDPMRGICSSTWKVTRCSRGVSSISLDSSR